MAGNVRKKMQDSGWKKEWQNSKPNDILYGILFRTLYRTTKGDGERKVTGWITVKIVYIMIIVTLTKVVDIAIYGMTI